MVQVTEPPSMGLLLTRRFERPGQKLAAVVLEPARGGELEMEVVFLPGVWDGPRLTRVLDNLLGDASKYSPDGEVITGRLGTGYATGTYSRGAVFSVEDHGIGIDSRDPPHVFERFHR